MKAEAGAVTAIELLILSSSLDDTEGIVTSLRNGGLAVHGTRLEDLRAFEEQLPTQDWDLILCCAYDPAINLEQVLGLYQDADRDIPLLVMADPDTGAERLLRAMREGVRDMVNRGELNHLQLVVAREFGDVQNRREVHRLRQRLLEAEQRALGLIDSSREAIAFVQDGIHVHVNGAYLELFGFHDRADVEDLPLLDLIDKADHKTLKGALKQLEGERKAVTKDLVCRREDGSPLEVSFSVLKASMDSEPGYQIIVRDKSRSPVEMEKRIHRLSTHDQDTQLPNRAFFMTQLGQRLAAADEERTGVLFFIVIENFAGLRGTQGVSWTDGLIHGIAETLRQATGVGDLLARFNDNSFVLLSQREDIVDLRQFAQELRQRVESDSSRDPALSPICGIGIVRLEDGPTNPEDLVKKAFHAYEATRRKAGSPQVEQPVVVAPPLPDADDGLRADIDAALSKGRFRLLYQPIVSLQGDTRENYAVLVRMLDRNDHEVLPELFFKTAEQMGKTADIDRWIIRNGIAALSDQRQQGRKINFFISLSEGSLCDKNLLLWIFDCLREFSARGGWLIFQVRAKHALDNFKEATKLIEGLKKIKCQVALDHFGLLSDPENLLDKLPVDFIKLAPNFSRDLTHDQAKQETLTAMNEMILAHGMKSIAMAVEDANSLTVLWTVGISYIQGYFLQEPSYTIEYGAQQLI